MTYVANQASGTVTVINGATNSTATVTVGNQPSAVAVNPVTNKAYVANYADNTVSVIDGSNNTTLIGVGTNPIALAINSRTNKIYVADQGSNDVMVIDGVSGTTTPVTAGTAPSALAVNPVTGKVYVANYGSSNVTVIDSSNNATTIAAGTNPFAVAVNAVTNTIYVANVGSNNVTVINGSNGSTTPVSTGNAPYAIAVNPITNKAYVADNQNANITVIDGSNNTTQVAAGTHPFAVAVDELTNQVYVTNQGSGNFTVIDGNNNPTNISGGTSPGALGVNPVTNKIYIANSGGANVSVVDGATNTVATFAAGTNPQAVAVNPVTNKVYVANLGAGTVSVLGGGTTSSVTAGTAPYAVAVNPITNKIYVVNNGSSNITVIDGVTNTPTNVGVGSSPYDVAVNPVTNKIYVANYVDGTVTVIDGVTNATTTVQDPNAKNPIAVAVNPVTNQIYVANVGDGVHQGSLTVIDGATNNTTNIPNMGVDAWAVAVNPVTNKIYVGHYLEPDVMVVDGTSNSVTTVTVGSEPFFLKVNSATNKVYIVNKGSNTVSVLDGATNTATSVSVGTNPFALAINQASDKIYVANYGGNNISVIDGTTNYTTTVTDPNVYLPQPTAVAVNPVTGQVYVANYSTGNVSVITEEQIQSVPVTATITPLANNLATSVAPVMSFTSTNSLTTGSPNAVFYQVDSWLGTWSSGISQGSGAFSGSTPTLSTGIHTVYAYATEGQASTSTNTGAQSSPLVGNITAYTFLVPAGAAPPAGVNLLPGALNFGSQQKNIPSAASTATLSNGTTSPLAFSIAISGTNASEFVEGSDTCSSLAGTLSAGSSCTISITFTPTATGARTATLTVTDNASGVAGSTQTVTLSGTGTGNLHPTITWATPASITYGTALGAQLNASASYNGTSLPGTFVYTPPAGTVLAVGSQTLSVTFTPTDTVDYTSATQTVQISITQATLTVSAAPATRVFGQANPTFTPSYSGFVSTDTSSVLTGAPSLTTSATATSPVASYPITVTQGNLSAANYTFSFVNGSMSVTKATPVLTWATPAPITPGTALSALQLDATALIPGAFVYTPAAGAIPTAGSSTLSVTFTPTDTADYTNATATVTLIVDQAKASFVGTDASTKGNWNGMYGSDGHVIANDSTSVPSYATFAVANQQNFTWTSVTADPRALENGAGNGRIASCWNGSTFTFDVNITDGNSHQIALYALDWDSYGGVRGETVNVVDVLTNAVLDSRNISNFTQGLYLVWNISGHVQISVTDTAGLNAVVSGVFFESTTEGVSVTPPSATLSSSQTQQFTAQVSGTSNQNVTWSLSPAGAASGAISTGGLYTAPASISSALTVTVKATSADGTASNTATVYLTTGVGTAANFAGTDTSTQGNWEGVYGGDGYAIADGAQSIPSYATFTPQNGQLYEWASNTTDVRALESGSGRVAATWFNAPTFDFDVNLSDGATHRVAVYALDWDGLGRAETIQIVNAATSAVLDTRTISGFANGMYVYWNIAGHVHINVTVSGGPNAVISGVFFGNGNAVQNTPVVAWSTPAAITYGTALSATQLDATASYNGTTVPGTFAYTPAVGAIPGAGSQTLSVTFTPTDGTHYTTATGTTTLVVNKATPVITWPTPSPITVGTALSATQLNAAASLNGTTVAGAYAYTPASGTVPALGSQTLSVTFTPTDTTDYTTATATVTLVVTNQSAPTIMWATPAPIAAGTALSATQLDASAVFNGSVVPGTYAYTPALGTVLGAGSQTLSVTFTPSNTALYTNATGTVTLVVNAAAGNQATYVGVDTTTQGNWEGVYGADGYTIATGTPSLPSYLSNFTVNGAGTYTWVTITTDPRAPQAGTGTGRIAATWFSGTNFYYDVNITDGQTHQVAVYALDWDTYQGGRIEQVQVLDATTNAVLDSRTISSFTGGEYVYWNIAGHVHINVAAVYSNAVISGVFFGSGNVVKNTPVVAWSTPAAVTYGTALSATQLDATASYNGTTVPGTFAYTPAAGCDPGSGQPDAIGDVHADRWDALHDGDGNDDAGGE